MAKVKRFMNELKMKLKAAGLDKGSLCIKRPVPPV